MAKVSSLKEFAVVDDGGDGDHDDPQWPLQAREPTELFEEFE